MESLVAGGMPSYCRSELVTGLTTFQTILPPYLTCPVVHPFLTRTAFDETSQTKKSWHLTKTTSIKISLQNPQVLKLNKILFYTSQKQKKMSDLRPYFIQIVKHEEKGDRFARVNMELLTTPRKEPFNPFVKTDMPSQSYPSCLRPACPRKPGCGACGSCCP